ncbi:phage regulatory CII family protein [Pantoea stewartii]|uniref:phage regulatory CII family protein n=1 Tax=Pantoea stewartii TaxID=66269 RepID=UPI00197F3BA5|nr:phage regulatory CII family protein [Pantoea stewartii]
MFDFRVSTHNHFDEACRRFALSHNMKELALSAGMNAQTLRNKLNPEQPHELTVKEMLSLTDLTEDSILMDGALAQLHCLPCVPVNEHAEEKLSAYVLKATAEVGQLAAGAMRHDALSTSCRRSLLQSVNTGIRCLTLAAIAVQTRIHSNPTMASTVDAISGLGASIGLS